MCIRDRISAQPLNTSDFNPYGSIVSPEEEVAKASDSAKNANQGTAIKILQVSSVQNTFPRPYSICTPNWNIFRCFPQQNLKREIISDSSDHITHNFKVLEKHPYSSQTFLPMGYPENKIGYLIIVALPDSTGEPDLATLKAFTCKGTQAVTYGAGIWHAPMIVVGEVDYLDFAVLIHELLDSDKPEMDCVERLYPENELTVKLCV